MADIEKVIKGLDCCLGVNNCDIERNEDCPYKDLPICATFLRSDVIALLKEQEAVKPKCKERMGEFVAGLCPTCGKVINNVQNVKACGKCGQAVKWE